MLDINHQVDHWLEENIISPDQAKLMRRSVVPPEPTDGRRIPLIAEILGYVGAALSFWAVGFMVSEFWEQLDTWLQSALFFGLSALLFVAGARLLGNSEGAFRRLSSILWLGSVASLAGAVYILFFESVGYGEDAALLTSAGVTAVASAYLLARQPAAPQQATLFVAVLTAAVAALTLGPNPEVAVYGWTVWALGLCWVVATRAGVLRPDSVGMIIGALTMFFGAQFTMSEAVAEAPGMVLGLATAGAFAGIGVAYREKLTIILGAVGIFWFVPQAMFHFFGEAIGGMLGLLVSGLVLIGLAVWFGRSRQSA